MPGRIAHLPTPLVWLSTLRFVVSCLRHPIVQASRFVNGMQELSSTVMCSLPVCVCVTRNVTVWGTHVCCCSKSTLYPHAVQSS